MTQERKPRAIIFFKDFFEYVIFSDPNVDVMIAHSGNDWLFHETQHPIPEWLMNDATEVVEREGPEPPDRLVVERYYKLDGETIRVVEEGPVAKPT